MDPYSEPMTPSKSKPQRRNPFSGDADDMGSAGTYRTSAPSANRREDEITDYQSQNRSGTSRASAPTNQRPQAMQQTSRPSSSSQCEWSFDTDTWLVTQNKLLHHYTI